MPGIDVIRSRVNRQRAEITQVRQAGISTTSAEELLGRMLNKIDDLRAERERPKKEQPARVSGARHW
jgi:hypothetical protein